MTTIDMPAEPPTLAVGLEVADVATLSLDGSLDAHSLVALEVQLDQLRLARCKDVVVDVSRLTSVDSAGTGALSRLRRVLTARGGSLRLVGASRTIRAALADAFRPAATTARWRGTGGDLAGVAT